MPHLRKILLRFGVDRAVSYAMAARLWQIPSGVVTTVLIALCFQPEQQGIYFLILSLTGLQALADAGLLNTLLHATSHEIAGAAFTSNGFLKSSRQSRQRLAGIYRFSVRWFSVASVALVVVGILGGALLLGRQGVFAEAIAPLSLALVLAGAALALAPLVAMLEGCDQVQAVNRIRLFQVISGSLAVWGCLILGGGLWAAVAAVAVQLFWELALVAIHYRRFFIQLHRTSAGGFDWRTEVWPLQWRIAVQSMVRTMAFFPILPILFDRQGPELAGQYGMTWQVISSLAMVAYVFVRTKSPQFGRLFAERKRAAANQLFRNSAISSTSLLGILVFSFCAMLGLLQQLGQFDGTVGESSLRVTNRFLPLTTCLLFALAVIPMHLVQCFSMVIRSQKMDPIWRVSIPGGALVAALASGAAWYGHIDLIPAAMIVIFTVSAIALAAMAKWYERHFKMAGGP